MLSGPNPTVSCLVEPAFAQCGDVGVFLARPGREGGRVGGGGTGLAGGFEFGFDLVATLGPQPQQPTWDAGDLGAAFVDWAPVDAEASGQLVTQHGLIHRPGGVLGAVDRLPVEGGPSLVGAAGDVGDEDMGVQLRVAGA